MDSFIKIIPQKKERPPTLHHNEIRLLKEYIDQGKNVFICGPVGCGKSFVVNDILDGTNSIELHSELFHKKHSFMNIVGDTSSHILIDGYDSSVYGHKQIVDRVSEDKERVTKGSVIVTSTSIHIIPNFELILIPRRSPDAIASLVCDNPRAQMASEKCKGNIRDFFDYLNFSDEKDVFKSSKDIIVDILCHTGSFDVSSAVHEHGHIVDVVHGNYTLSKNANHSAIINSLSLADVYDTIMYKGDWELMPYYINSGMAIPKQYMGDPLKSTHIQPGSTWTKYGNYKMRYNKLRSIQTRHANSIGLEELCVIRQYAIAGNFEPLINYKLTPNDFDVMNHLAVGNKLKAAEVTKVKKKLRTMINE